jgi:hypothetical protein
VHAAGVFVALVEAVGILGIGVWCSGVECQIAAHTAHVKETAELNDKVVSCTQQVCFWEMICS